MNTKEKISTSYISTWCQGCTNFAILESVKKTIAKLIDNGLKQEDFVMVTGIGCNSKIFDYINISGIYGLHGRTLPTAFGVKIANPDLKVIIFAGDGDTYAEGMEHFIHNCRYNADLTLVVHDNRSFSLTTGQATPTSQQGFRTKAEPFGEINEPINPIKLALAAGATFVARCDAKNILHTSKILEKAINHRGFSFIEIIQDCHIFNFEYNFNSKIYEIKDNNDNMNRALKLANEFDYNSLSRKVPIGIFYQIKKPTFEDRWIKAREKK